MARIGRFLLAISFLCVGTAYAQVPQTPFASQPYPSDAIQYVTTNGNDSNDGRSLGSAKLTYYAACESLPGGAVSPPRCGSGAIYYTDTIWWQSNHAFGGMFMGSGDPNSGSPPAGWILLSGAIKTVCVSGETSFSNGSAPCLIQGGGNNDNVHPGLWLSAWDGGSLQYDGLKLQYQGRNVVIGVCSNGTNDGSCSVQDLQFNGIQTAQGNNPSTAGPAWLVGKETLYMTVNDYSIGGNGNASPTADNAASVLFTGDNGCTCGGIVFNNGQVSTGGFKVYAGSGSAIAINQAYNDNSGGSTEAQFWLVSGTGTWNLVGLEGLSDCLGADCYTIRNDTSIAVNAVNTYGIFAGPVVLTNSAPTGNPITTSIKNLYGTVTPTYLRMQMDAASRQFGPIVVPGTSLVPTTLTSGNITCGSCTVTTGVVDPSGGTQAVSVTDTGSENLLISATGDGGAVVGDTETFSAWVAAPNGVGWPTFPLALVQVNTGTVCAETGTFEVVLQDISGGSGYEHYIGKCTLTTYSNPGTPTLQIGVSSTQPVKIAFPQLILLHGRSADEVADIALNIGSWKSSLAAGSLGDLLGAVPHVFTGTITLGTSAITAGTCATTATATVTGAAESTDNVSMNPSAAIKGVTGYFPATSGAGTLTIYPPYVSANTINVDVCNWTLSSITPGAVTLTFHDIR